AKAHGSGGALTQKGLMSLSLFANFGKAPLLSAGRGWGRLAAAGLCVALPGLALGQGSYSTNGVEYAIAGALPGDQVHPQLGLQPSGGYLVWEDNLTDGYGWGVSALRLDSGFSGVLAP